MWLTNKLPLGQLCNHILLWAWLPFFAVGCGRVDTALSPVLNPNSPQDALYQLTVDEAQQPALDLQFAEVYHVLGDNDASLAYTIAGSEGDPQELNVLAENLLASGRSNAARDLWQQVLLVSPDNSTAHFQLGISLLPDDTRTAYQHFEVAAQDAAYTENAERLMTVIAQVDESEPSQYAAQIGAALVSYGYWDAAEKSFTTALTLTPDYPNGSGWFNSWIRVSAARSGKS